MHAPQMNLLEGPERVSKRKRWKSSWHLQLLRQPLAGMQLSVVQRGGRNDRSFGSRLFLLDHRISRLCGRRWGHIFISFNCRSAPFFCWRVELC